MKEAQFEIGKWYNCSCNSNLYQFDGFLENKKFGSSAVINPKEREVNDEKPGYKERICQSALAEYFSPSSLADMDVVNKFLPKEKEEKWIPQVGDEVKFNSNWDKLGHSGYYDELDINKIYKIDLIGNFSFPNCKNDNCIRIGEIYKGWIPSEVVDLYKERPSNSVSSSLPIEGEYYRVKDSDLGDFFMIGKVTRSHNPNDSKDESKRGYANFISSHNKELNINSSWAFENDKERSFKLATQEEREWLDRCIAAGKYLERTEIPESKKDSFALPEKWCVKGNQKEGKLKDNDPQLFNSIQRSKHPFKADNIGFYTIFYYFPTTEMFNHDSCIPSGYTEITFDQFKEHVLKENVAEKEQKKSWSHLIKEAAEMYPIGSMFYDLVHKAPFVVASHDFDSFGNQNQIYVPVNSRPGFTNKTARLYKDGVWAQKCIDFGSTVYSGNSKYIMGIDPYAIDDRVMGLAMAVQAQSINELKSVMNNHLGVSAVRMGTSGQSFTGLYEAFSNPEKLDKYPLLSIEEEELTFDPSLVKPIKSVNLLLSIEE